MAEFSNSNIVSVAAGENLPLTETAVKAPACIVHREGSGLVTIARSDQRAVPGPFQSKLWRQYRHSHRRHRGTHFRGAGCRR